MEFQRETLSESSAGWRWGPEPPLTPNSGSHPGSECPSLRRSREPEDLPEEEGDRGLEASHVFFTTSLCTLGKSPSFPGLSFPFLPSRPLAQMAPKVPPSSLPWGRMPRA